MTSDDKTKEKVWATNLKKKVDATVKKATKNNKIITVQDIIDALNEEST